MVLPLSRQAKIEKNKLFSSGVWIILLEIDLGKWNLGTIRLAKNNEDVTWNGKVWVAFPFLLGVKTETSKGEVSGLQVSISNVNRMMQAYIEATNGAIGAEAIVRVVHSNHLDLTRPEIEEHFEITECVCDVEWITLTLSAPNPFLFQFPRARFIKDWCRWKFKSPECGYTGNDTECGHTFSDCVAKGNHQRFGGFPSLLPGGIWL